MKTNSLPIEAARRALFAACVVVFCGGMSAQTKPSRMDPVLIDDVMDRPPAPLDMKEVTYLGVSTRSIDAAMASQLDLPAETGLAVVQILPDSPAAGVLKQHDLLTRLDDQVLIEPRQLGVLVRGRKNGDVVKLTFFRGGKQQTESVTLGKKKMPALPERFEVGRRRALPLVAGGPAPMVFAHRGPGAVGVAGTGGPGERRLSVMEAGNAVMVFDDGEGRLEVSFKEGKKQLTARNKKGDIIYNGAAETPEDRRAMPADVRARLEKMEAMDVRVPAHSGVPGDGRGAGVFEMEQGELLEMPAGIRLPVPVGVPLPAHLEAEGEIA